jgi:hypothetical protein
MLLALVACSEQRAQELAAAQLIDPSSAQFRNVRTATAGALGTRVCGEINGKNRMGAYAGFTRFIVNPETESVEMDQPNATTTSNALAQLEQCRRPSYGGYIRDCSYDQERYAEAMLAEMFETNWRRYCDGDTSTSNPDGDVPPVNIEADSPNTDSNLTM